MKPKPLKAIHNLYTVFKPYTILGNLRDRSCDCCVTNEEIKELLSKPLKELGEDEIYHCMTSAITTFGETEDYKHFLPRILELMITSETVIEDFLTYEKLNYSNWLQWNLEEVDAIKKVFKALLINALKNNLDTINNLIQLNLTYVDFESLTKILLETNSKKWLLTIIENALYDNSYPEDKRLKKLYSNKSILEKIEKLFLETSDKELANRISIAYSLLENKS